jgi:hypothetical protein
MTTKGQMTRKPNSRAILTASKAGENSQTNGPEPTQHCIRPDRNTKELNSRPTLWGRGGSPCTQARRASGWAGDVHRFGVKVGPASRVELEKLGVGANAVRCDLRGVGLPPDDGT